MKNGGKNKAAKGKRYCSADLIYYAARNAAQRALQPHPKNE